MTTRRILIVVAPTYAEAERMMRSRILPADYVWLWFAAPGHARRWLARCAARGIRIDESWTVPVTAWRQAS